MIIKKIFHYQTYPLRSLVLRPGFPIESCHFEGDEKSTSFHLGCYIEEQVVGIASFVLQKHAAFEFNCQYRLRGMATHPQFLKQGVASSLLKEGERLVLLAKGELIWFNARKVAYFFYEKGGYQFWGEEFDIPTVGPHKVMYKVL